MENSLPNLDTFMQRIFLNDKLALESAEWVYRRLVNLINSFEINLPEDMQAGGQFVNFSQKIFRIENIGFWEPDLIIFDGNFDDDSHAQLVQNKNQLNLLIVAVRRTDDTSKPRRKIGFVCHPKLDEPVE